MKKEIEHIIEEALRVFKKTTGLEVNHQTEHLNIAMCPDGLVQIVHQNMRWHFIIEAKKKVTRTIAGMKKLGFGTRDKFDEIAENAKTTKDAVLARKQLDALMNNCIACHMVYRLPEPKE